MPRRPLLYADSSAVSAPTALARRSVAAADRPRLLVVARWPLGGIRTHLLVNYTALAEAGFRFTFVGPAGATLDALRDGFGDLEGASFIGAPVEGRRCRLWPVVRGLLREGGFGLIHSHGATAVAHSALANFGVDVPHIATLHDPMRDSEFSGLLGRFKRWALARALSRTDVIITVTYDAQANLFEYYPALRGRADRVRTIHNGIDAAHYALAETTPTNELRERLGLDAQPFLMGFLGRFMPQKGFLVLLEALERLAKAETVRPFHLVGFGSGDLRREYQKAILRRGLEKFITLLDLVTDVGPVLRQLDLVVMPSLWEACPLLPMEAMAAGVPVLGSDCIGLREVLRDTPSRMVPANDSAALTTGLRSALEEPWTEAARAFAPAARERFDNAHSVRCLLEMYEAMATQTPRVALSRAS